MVTTESTAAVAAAVMLALALTLLAGVAPGGATSAQSPADAAGDATPQYALDCDEDDDEDDEDDGGPPPWANNDDDDDDEDDEDDDCEETTTETTTTTMTTTTVETTEATTTTETTMTTEATTATTTTTIETTETATSTESSSTVPETESSDGATTTTEDVESTTGSGATDIPRDAERTTATGEALFYVSDAELSVSSVRAGTDVFVSAQVRNRGDGAGEFETELVVGGEVRATHVVSLAPGEQTTVRFRLSVAEPGSHDVAVNHAGAGALTVVADDRASDAGPGPLEISSPSLRADWVKSGHETAVTAVVRNPTNDPVNRTVRVTVDGAVVARHSVWLAPGEQTEVTIPFEAVDGTVAVDGVPAGELSVSESLGAVDANAHVVDDRGDGGFGVGLALVGTVGLALLAGVVVATRRET